jgi:hypothetical protein
MKVYCLYYKENFVVAFPNREDAINYGKNYYAEYSWDCNIIEEYLHKSPLAYTPPYATITPQQTIPCTPGMTLTSAVIHKNPYNTVVAGD